MFNNKRAPGAPVDLTQFVTLDDDSTSSEPNQEPHTPKSPSPRKGKVYFGGGIPRPWLERAAALPGRAFHLACAVWFEAVCNKTQHSVPIPANTRRLFGLASRHTFYRALQA